MIRRDPNEKKPSPFAVPATAQGAVNLVSTSASGLGFRCNGVRQKGTWPPVRVVTAPSPPRRWKPSSMGDRDGSDSALPRPASTWPGVDILTADIAVDDNGLRYKASSDELAARGWRLILILTQT